MFKLEIETGGAAFCDPFTGEEDEIAECHELYRIIDEQVLRKIAYGYKEGVCMDINGNKVGSWSL